MVQPYPKGPSERYLESVQAAWNVDFPDFAAGIGGTDLLDPDAVANGDKPFAAICLEPPFNLLIDELSTEDLSFTACLRVCWKIAQDSRDFRSFGRAVDNLAAIMGWVQDKRFEPGRLPAWDVDGDIAYENGIAWIVVTWRGRVPAPGQLPVGTALDGVHSPFLEPRTLGQVDSVAVENPQGDILAERSK